LSPSEDPYLANLVDLPDLQDLPVIPFSDADLMDLPPLINPETYGKHKDRRKEKHKDRKTER
jgi:hypothetical protein